MTTESRLTRDLPEILGDLAIGPYPDYIDDVLAASAMIRQRPTWAFLERWFPVVDIVRQAVGVPRLPWRSIALAVVLLGLLLAAAAVYVGSQQRIPAPFGLARNGLVAYDAGGDIYTVDPVTGAATKIVSGPGLDVRPRFSLEGTRIVFERQVDVARSELYIVRPDGTNLTRVTPEPLALAPGGSGRAWERYKFSPDGQSVLIATMDQGLPAIAIARSDGGGIRRLDVGMPATEPTYRPPDGAEVLFIGRGSDLGIFAVNLSTNEIRQIVKTPIGFDLAGANWSPDGSKITYWTWNVNVDGLTAKSHIVNADGTDDRELPAPPGAIWNSHATWSNDGKSLFIARGYTPGEDDVRGVVIPADGSSVGVEVAPAGSVETDCCAAWVWAPDDSKLLGRAAPALGGPLPPTIVDLAARTTRLAPWSTTSDPTWERLAP